MNNDTIKVDHSEAGHNYRLEKIKEIQKNLEEQRLKRRDLSEKYFKTLKWVNNADAVLITISLGVGLAGIGLLSTIIAAPAVIGLESVALCTGILSIVGKYASKKLTLKAQKHEKIKTLIDDILNILSTLISEALNDGNISDEEFSRIINEFEKFQKMKNEITRKTREKIGEEINNSLFEEWRRDARESAVEKIRTELYEK